MPLAGGAIKDFSCALIVAVLATSCATAADEWSAVNDTGASIDFFNTSTFDHRMSSALRGNPATLTVNLVAPATLNNIPERLGSWVSMVESYEGKIELQDDSKVQTRTFVDPVSLVLAGITVYKAVDNKLMYRPVHAYNATIHYQGSGNITKVVFTRKE